MFNTKYYIGTLRNTVRYLPCLQTANAKHIKYFPDLIPIEHRAYAAITSRNMGDRRESEGDPEAYSLTVSVSPRTLRVRYFRTYSLALWQMPASRSPHPLRCRGGIISTLLCATFSPRGRSSASGYLPRVRMPTGRSRKFSENEAY